MRTLDLVVIAIYLSAVLVIGYLASKKIKTIGDYAFGGKTIPPLIIVASSVATAAGAGTSLGNAGRAYTDGFAALWLVVAWAFGMFCLAMMSDKIYKTDATSISGVFEHIHGKTVGRVSSIYTVIYSFGMLIIQMVGMGTVLKLILGNAYNVSYEMAVIVGGAIVILYTLQGGFIAVAYTDTLQMIILSVSMVIIFPLVTFVSISSGGSIAQRSLDLVFNPPTFNLINNLGVAGLIAIIFKYTFSACTGIPYIQRIFASKNAQQAKQSQIRASFGYLILGCVIIITAVFARLMYPQIDNPDTIVVRTILEKFPVILAGLGIAALISAVMSSVDSYLLVSSQMFTEDIIGWVVKDMKERQSFIICKVMTVIFGIIALLAALKFTQILVIYEFGAMIYASAIFFPFIFSLYYKKTTKLGAISGMLSGSIVSITLTFVDIGIRLDPVIFGNFVSLMFTFFVSLATFKPKNQTE